MVASLFAGRLQFFVVEELGQLVLDGVETRLFVELVLELQSLDTKVVEPLGVELGPECVVQRLDDEVMVHVGDRAAEDADAETVYRGAVGLDIHAGAGQLFRRLVFAVIGREVAGRVVRTLGCQHHRDAGDLDDARIVSTDALFLDHGDTFHIEMLADAGRALR